MNSTAFLFSSGYLCMEPHLGFHFPPTNYNTALERVVATNCWRDILSVHLNIHTYFKCIYKNLQLKLLYAYYFPKGTMKISYYTHYHFILLYKVKVFESRIKP